MNKELIDIICCPETKQSLTVCDRAILKDVNKMVQSGKLKNRGGELVNSRIDDALIREDRKIIYPVRHSIPILLIHEGIDISEIITK